MGISPFMSMFGRSPLKPLEKHMNKVHDCVKHLLPFFNAVQAEVWSNAETAQKQIASLENEADALKKDLRLHLPSGLFLPVPRTDILELVTKQDRIANKAEDIAGIVFGRRMVLPPAIAHLYMDLLKCCIEASNQARKAINELDELLETGFRGNEIKVVGDMIVKLDTIEHDSDELQVTLRQELYKIESKLSPVDVMFIYKLIDWTGDLADRAQTVGGQLQLLLAR